MAELRARAGDRDLAGGAVLRDSRSYDQERPKQFDDLAYYEGR